MYKKQARIERFELTNALIECKMKEGSSMSEHIVKLAGYVDRLASLEFGIPPTLGTDIVLASLPPSYDGFIMNYIMNKMEKSANELFAMLKTAEAGMQKNKEVLMVNKTVSFKKGKSKKNLTTKKNTSVIIRLCHSRSLFLSCLYIHDNFMTESR
jgi:hypothetical protein